MLYQTHKKICISLFICIYCSAFNLVWSQNKIKVRPVSSSSNTKVKKEDKTSTAQQVQSEKKASTEKKAKKDTSTKTPKATREVGQEKALPNDRVAVQRRSVSHKGATGLSETLSADTGPQGTLRLALFFGSFQTDSFLTPGTEDTFSKTYLSFSYTPLEALEVYANTRALSHFNRRNTPNTIQSQGDLNFGVKGSKFWKTIGVGGALDTQLYSGIGGGFNWSATSVNMHALFTVDLMRRTEAIPFRFLLDIQYTFENSEALFDSLPEEPNLIQEWGFQSARYDRLHLHFGFEVPTQHVSVFTEYHIATPFLVEMTRLGRYSNIFAFESIPHSLNLGARGFIKEYLAVETSVHFGLSDQPTTGVPATPPWIFWMGLNYTLDPRPKVIEREIKVTPPKPKPVVTKPIGTLLTLTILDKTKKKPIRNATVSYLGQSQSPQKTDDNGQITGYRFPPVSMKIKVEAEGYQSKTVKVKIPKSKEQLKAKLSLKPSAGKSLAQVQIQLAPDVIQSLQQAALDLTMYGPESRKSTILDQPYQTKVKPGEYILTLSNDKGIQYYQVLILGEGGISQKTIELSDLNSNKQSKSPQKFHKKKNKWASYDLKRKRLIMRRAINFKGDSDRLTTSSQKAVRGLANLIGKEARITQIKIYVYTHSIGNSRKDKRLGQQRGNRIKAVLKNKGIDPAKIKIISYGSSKNQASNFTKRGQQKNQKVRFSIKVKKTL